RAGLGWVAVNGATGYDVRVFAPGNATPVYSGNNVKGLTAANGPANNGHRRGMERCAFRRVVYV
ncbi:MAG TPA: hypothetical protein PK992_11535, partial [Planctomycetaceae bacterium]|nr:hypothetical protein [Planctomycetaceae bacterium]